MKWKTLINKTNASTFRWPEGWDTREKVAEQLECSPDRVREVLASAIRTGAVEVKDFKIWEDGRFVRKTGFRAMDSTKQTKSEKVQLVKGLRVASRRAGGSGVVTKIGKTQFVVDWGDKRTTYGLSAWDKKDVRAV